MDLRLIQSFLAFGSSNNIVEAAKKLGVSQPALSDHLRKLEDNLPEKIFIQKGRRKALTPYGLEIFKALQFKLEGIDEIISGAGRSLVSEEKTRLAIAGRKEILQRLALHPLSFKGRVEFFEADGAKVVSQLTSGKADIVLTANPPDGITFLAKPLFTYSFQILVPRSWMLGPTHLNKNLMTELIKKPYLGYRKDFHPLQNLLHKFSVNSEPREVLIFDDWTVLTKLVEQGRGWTLAPTGFAVDEKKVDFFQLPKELRQEDRFFLVFYKEQYQIPWFKAVVKEMLEIF